MILYDFARPESLEHAAKLLADKPGRSRLIAGGTDLLIQLHEENKNLRDLELVVDLSVLATELGQIKEDRDYVYIGSLATHDMIDHSEIIRREFRHLSAASSHVGSPQIRHLGTIGGGVCNASPASDVVPPLVASDAVVEIYGLSGSRSVDILDFMAQIDQGGLKNDEIVTGFKLKKFPADSKCGFAKVGRRKALAISRLNAAVVLFTDGNDLITDARVAPGCIFRIPDRVQEAEESLIGKKISQESFAEAGEIVSRVMIERTGYRWSTPYKEIAVKAVITDALCDACDMEVF